MISKEIHEQILDELHKIEDQHNLHILYACESGSRMWGFESVNSDYDVRFIYVKSLEWYLGIEEKKRDNYELLVNDLIDISGWDLRKTLHLFNKGNPGLIEWLKSCYVYMENGSAIHQMRKLIEPFFSEITTIYHFLHMGKGNFDRYIKKKERVLYKKYLYVLRPILAVQWTATRHSSPPVLFQELVDNLSIEDQVREQIKHLVLVKKSGTELGEGNQIDVLHDYLGEQIDYWSKYIKTQKSHITSDQKKERIEILNEIFFNEVKREI